MKNKFFKKCRPVAILLVLTISLQTGPFLSVSSAGHTGYGDMHGGIAIGNVTSTSAPGDLENGDQPPQNNSANCEDTDPVLMSSGEFTITDTDLCPDKSVMPIEFIRTCLLYTSRCV